MSDGEKPESETDSTSHAQSLIRSTKHYYEDATVYVVVEDTVYAVHKSLLKKFSKYFDAMFMGPWREAQTGVEKAPFDVRGVVIRGAKSIAKLFTLPWRKKNVVETPDEQKEPVSAPEALDCAEIKEIFSQLPTAVMLYILLKMICLDFAALFKSLIIRVVQRFIAVATEIRPAAHALSEVHLKDLRKEEFELLLDVIYNPVEVQIESLEISQLLILLFTTEYLQCDGFQDAAKRSIEKHKKNWDNINEFFAALSDTPAVASLEGIRNDCLVFLKSAANDRWVHVLHIAEQYEVSELLSDELKSKWPIKPWKSPIFKQLSIELQNWLLLNYTVHPCSPQYCAKYHCCGCPRYES
ncbi:uncharacterized protein EV422DRAFT_509132 [Fimicolochytrium jonesii]|uniref:uncharacterized protein n=1 Tax=Fimicolochytrium jonesii TaxID=1396493 RepID=UPI0022FE305B|nr:uncharacterized protein EV422DRAFT_509132 [Fimicolochytrium jonesii]KAI8817305.1 hypothetical protein EV422DRAFT_509132 [Fimicolochytrium jonesii]